MGAVVLAAGASTRLGQPKQLLVLQQERLVERAVRIASNACASVVLVLGANADEILKVCRFKGVSVVVNEAWEEGMGSSIRAGVERLSDVDGLDGLILMTCDMPAVTSDHLKRLSERGALTASQYGDKHGVPAYFPAASFPQLLRLQGKGGAKELLQEAFVIDLRHGEVDIDTVEDYERAKAFPFDAASGTGL